MEALTVITFLLLLMGLGFSALLLTKPRPWPETILLSTVLGLAIWPFLILFLRVVHIPMDIRVIAPLAVIGPVIGLWKNRIDTRGVDLKRAAVLCAVILLTAATTWTMYEGATAYEHLEDDDPWAHAVGARYVAMEKTTWQPEDSHVSHYLEPYPPYFTALMGTMHQISLDLRWTLKFLNALIIGLTIICIFYAAEALTNDQYKGLAVAAIVMAMPSFMSHFIWAQTIAIPVFFMALWALSNVPNQKRWWLSHEAWLATILVWSATIIQPSSSTVFAMMFVVYAIVRVAMARHKERMLSLRHAGPIVAGGVLAFLTWAAFVLRYGFTNLALIIGIRPAMFTGKGTEDTSGGVVYSLGEIVFAPSSSKIDQATGLGWFVALLCAIAVILIIVQWRRTSSARNAIMLGWLVLTLLGIEANALPVQMFPHRFWAFLSIPVAFLAVEAIFAIGRPVPGRWAMVGVITALVAIAVITNLGPRLAVQQAGWPPGVMWTAQTELDGYLTLPKTLPLQTRILSICSEPSKLIGLNMAMEPWDPEVRAMREQVTSVDGTAVLDLMRSEGYEYLIFDVGCTRAIGENETTGLVQSVMETGAFIPAAQQPGFLLLRRNA